MNNRQLNPGRPHRPNRKFFDAVIRNEERILSTEDDALRFLRAIAEFEEDDEKKALVQQLKRANAHGLRRMGEAVNLLVDGHYINAEFHDLLLHLRDPALESGIVGKMLDVVLLKMLREPGVAEALGELAEEMVIEDVGAISWWLYRCVKREKKVLDSEGVLPLVCQLAQYQDTHSRRLRVLVNPPDIAGGEDASGRELLFVPSHDNDHENFKEIRLIPTNEEINVLKPFLPALGNVRLYEQVDEAEDGTEKRERRYLDWLFRLLREDVVGSIREALNGRDRRIPSFINVKPVAVLQENDEKSYTPLVLRVQFSFPAHHPLMRCRTDRERRDFVARRGRRLVPRGALACLTFEGIGNLFAKIKGCDEKLLEIQPTQSIVDLELDRALLEAALDILQQGVEGGTMRIVHQGFFSYEPTLRALQSIDNIPLAEEIIHLGKPVNEENDVDMWRANAGRFHDVLGTLDDSQYAAVNAAMTQRLTLVQGPPGTGKSFVGAKIAKILHEMYPEERIHVLCFTNHALDQFALDLLDEGLTNFVRIGGRSQDERIQQHGLPPPGGFLSDRHAHAQRREAEGTRGERMRECKDCIQQYLHIAKGSLKLNDVASVLTPEEMDDLTVPESQDGFQVAAGRGQRAFTSDDLWERWVSGRDRGPLNDMYASSGLWDMPRTARARKIEDLRKKLLVELKEGLLQSFSDYEDTDKDLAMINDATRIEKLHGARLVASTATGAAIHRHLLEQVQSSFVIVEEAGELLEAHVLTSLFARCRKLIMIGDHKQLRPKLEQYALCVESGQGIDYDRSLFERLVLSGYPHTTLSSQFRMHPDLSYIIREMTYPDLQDSERVRARPSIKCGLQERLLVAHHTFPEGGDESTGLSKRNIGEAEFVVRIVGYLLQQDGIGPKNITVLTPYLGQLMVLREKIQQLLKNIRAEVGTLDRAALSREGEYLASDSEEDGEYDELAGSGAGTPRRGKQDKGKSKDKAPMRSAPTIKVATIDNYQGEEADIIVASMVRSNDDGGLGFMREPERVNVLFSRARHTLILAANTDTIQESLGASIGRRGGKSNPWQKLLPLLQQRGALFEGLAVRCARHDTRACVTTAEEFHTHCPEGGCSRQCGARLLCGHFCPLRCHGHNENAPPRCTVGQTGKCQQNHMVPHLCGDNQSVIDAKCITCRKLREIQAELEREQTNCEKAKALAQRRIEVAEEKRKNAEKAKEMAAEVAQKNMEAAEAKMRADLEEKRKKAVEKLLQEKNRAVLDAKRKEAEEELRRETRLAEEKLRVAREEELAKLEREAQQKEAQAANELNQAREMAERKERELQEKKRASEERIARQNQAAEEAARRHEAAVCDVEAQVEREVAAAEAQMREAELRARDAIARARELGDAAEAHVRAATRKCVLCFEDVPLLQGIVCHGTVEGIDGAVGHFLCDECFAQYVQTESQEEVAQRAARNGEIRCPLAKLDQCDSACFSEAEVSRHTPPEIFPVFLCALIELKEMGAREEVEERARQERQREARRTEHERRVQRVVEHVRERILNLACPRCNSVYADFSGCCALTCPTCRCGFCAWCLADCGNDAHGHVANCAENQAPGRDVFAAEANVVEHHRVRRGGLVAAYLRDHAHDQAVTRDALEQLAQDFADLGIVVRV